MLTALAELSADERLAALGLLHEARKELTRLQQLQTVHLTLAGRETDATSGGDWSPLAGVPGVETRIVNGSFLMEARYEPGTESPGTIEVPQAVYVLVEKGIFWLALAGEDYRPYTEGMYIYLPPGQPHRWRCEGQVLNLLPFVPAAYRTPPQPE